MITAATYLTALFGVFIMACGMLMTLRPDIAKKVIGMAASTAFINYAEITLRLIPAFSFIIVAEHSKFPIAFKILGYLILITSFILYLIPRKWHHDYATFWSKKFKPLHLVIIGPISVFLGVVIIYGVLY